MVVAARAPQVETSRSRAGRVMVARMIGIHTP
jgi:hypothetical protein